MSRSKIEFSKRLFASVGEEGFGPYYTHGIERFDNDLMIEIVSMFLSKIFKDVESFKMGDKVIDIEKTCNGKCKFLGDVFAMENSKELGFSCLCHHGLYYQIGSVVTTEIKTCFDFNVKFYDDKFIVTETYGDKKEVESLMEPKYQKRYVELMSKRFGHEYKKHCRSLAKEKEAVKEKELSL